MKVEGLDTDVRVESVLVDEDRAARIVGHLEAIREKLVVNVVRRFLYGNEVPPSCHLLFDSPTGSRVPIVDA